MITLYCFLMECNSTSSQNLQNWMHEIFHKILFYRLQVVAKIYLIVDYLYLEINYFAIIQTSLCSVSLRATFSSTLVDCSSTINQLLHHQLSFQIDCKTFCSLDNISWLMHQSTVGTQQLIDHTLSLFKPQTRGFWLISQLSFP